MKKQKKTKLKILISLIISLFILIWLFLSIEWTSVIEAMKHLNYIYLGISFIIIVLHFIFRTIRWKLLLNSNPKYNNKIGFDSIQLGNFVNYILPLRAGEIARPLLLTKKTKIPFPTTMASVVVERFFDLACVLALFALLVYLIPDLPVWASEGVFVLGILAFIILTVMSLASFYPRTLKKTAIIFLNFLPSIFKKKILKLLDLIIEGTSVLNQFKNLIFIIGLTAIIWFSNILLFYIWTLMLPNAVASFELSLACSVLIALAVAAPSAPGFIGVYQIGCVAAFAIFGIDKETAIAFSLVTHLFQYIIIIGYGVYLVFKYGLNLKEYS